eukprot:c17973_g1_i1.p1 GENE.c17973_g1_i1~~c17973_g1_i1.p1  ORF type:complete len:487 (+),score=246.70 c17973_g1_i1:68-1528(+)
MSITSDEVNYLVYRYLQESGFIHTAFSFSAESMVNKCRIDGSHVPSGALITYLQKGLQYVEIETHLTQDGSEIGCDAPFSLTQPHICHIVQQKNNYSGHDNGNDNANGTMDMSDDSGSGEEGAMVQDDDVVVLKGHTHEVFVCGWCPTNPILLASGSGDGTVRIWDTSHPESNPLVLQHFAESEGDESKNRGITTLEWASNGKMLATGSYEGQAFVWTIDGTLKFTLEEHKGPIFALKWNMNCTFLLSGSADKSAIIWDAQTGKVKQKFAFHEAPTLDVDWKDNETFASCSTDKMIYVCRLGELKPIKSFEGHEDEVNTIRWDPRKKYLASCSDDFSIKIWTMESDKFVFDLKGHEKEIFTIRWSNTGPETPNPLTPLYLASASQDASIKIWELENGTCLHTLTKHRDPVYSISFSPNGKYISSGSCGNDGNSERGDLQIWSVSDGTLIKTHRNSGGIFEVYWNITGEKVAACFSNATLTVVSFKT